LIPLAGGDTVEQQQELQCGDSGSCAQAVVQKWMSGLRTLAGCLRTHGEPNWPDPIITSLGGHPTGRRTLPATSVGIDHRSDKVLNEVRVHAADRVRRAAHRRPILPHRDEIRAEARSAGPRR
jgi:hypothetical protein